MNPSLCYCWHDGSGGAAACCWWGKDRLGAERRENDEREEKKRKFTIYSCCEIYGHATLLLTSYFSLVFYATAAAAPAKSAHNILRYIEGGKREEEIYPSIAVALSTLHHCVSGNESEAGGKNPLWNARRATTTTAPAIRIFSSEALWTVWC